MASNNQALQDTCNVDRISSLPDDVLSHILSFLPTEDSFGTSVLSTRWEKVSTLVPILDFKYNKMSSPNEDSSNSRSRGPSNFIKFIDSVLLSYNVSRMKKLSLKIYGNENLPKYFRFHSWLSSLSSSVIQRNVQEIDIFISSKFTKKVVLLPPNMFTCNTLVTLRLNGPPFKLVLPRSVSLPCLKTCQFRKTRFTDDSGRGFFKSCTALEDLELDDCCMDKGAKILDITAPILKSFKIKTSDTCQLVLNVPNLLYFEYKGSLFDEIFGLETLKSVVDATICYKYNSLRTKHNLVPELVRSISHVQYLCLGSNVEKLLCKSHSWPTFENVTRLSLAYFTYFSPKALSTLLDKLPQLESLFYGKGCTDCFPCFSPKHVPACVSLNLKEVSMSFYGTNPQRDLIHYFLKYAKNLKEIKLRRGFSWYVPNVPFEISSSTCKIVFDKDDDIES